MHITVRPVNGRLSVSWAVQRGYVGNEPLVAYGHRWMTWRERWAWRIFRRIPTP